MSQVVDAGLRPLRLFATVLLLAGIGMLLAAVVIVVHGATADVHPVAGGRAGEALRLSGPVGTVHVLASVAGGGSFTTDDACTVAPAHAGAQVGLDAWPRTLTLDRTTYRSFRTVKGWRVGDTVTCTGPHVGQVVALRDSRMSTLAIAALFGVAGLGGTFLGVVGVRARRRAAGPRP